jgi:hypothetical protein
MTEKKSKNIYQKIALVMADVSYLNKDDKVAYGNTRYSAMSEEKVTGVVREAMLKHGLVIFPTSQEVECRNIVKKDRNGEDNLVGFLTTTNTSYTMADIDSGETITVASSGMGVDTQDKGVGKAMTYSFKYALLRSFAIPTGDDPDKISSDELTAKQEEELEKAVKKNKKGTDQDVEELLKEKFPGTKVVEEPKKKQEKTIPLAEDPEIIALKEKVVKAGTSPKVADALVRSYTPENKDTLIKILESKL